MKKEQTYIAYWWYDSKKDEKYGYHDFERWTCKRVSTVVRNCKKLVHDYPHWFGAGDFVEIRATPTVHEKDEYTVATFRIADALEGACIRDSDRKYWAEERERVTHDEL